MRHSFFLKFFHLSIAAILISLSMLAHALPSPKDIDAAVSAGKLEQAESMLREVISEKPQSAKAQYELGQVLARQARYTDAQIALNKAKELDPSLKFTNSPQKFSETLETVARKVNESKGSQQLNGIAPIAHSNSAATVSGSDTHFPLSYIWLGIGGLVILAFFLRRKAAGPSFSPNASGAASYAPANSPVGNPQNYPQPGYAPQQPMGSGIGSGIGGAVVGGLAGVAAGYALSKALEGDHHSNSISQNQDNAYVPIEKTPPPNLGSFDSGTGNDWDDSSSSDGGDESW